MQCKPYIPAFRRGLASYNWRRKSIGVAGHPGRPGHTYEVRQSQKGCAATTIGRLIHEPREGLHHGSLSSLRRGGTYRVDIPRRVRLLSQRRSTQLHTSVFHLPLSIVNGRPLVQIPAMRTSVLSTALSETHLAEVQSYPIDPQVT